ncbi:patatin-like phospholipase family protein [Ferrimonas marina]|uniref:Patatin-like phospholipase n=1 Tax=Ferrimonas marina TaxID=299255 RepID=A0A1M5RYJ0_9GAMM|nr:patatin-like phospholipase family protein [Ferrimonas marina]SHH31270.1 Patatin-like phospholipase [Ferrimonas marina]
MSASRDLRGDWVYWVKTKAGELWPLLWVLLWAWLLSGCAAPQRTPLPAGQPGFPLDMTDIRIWDGELEDPAFEARLQQRMAELGQDYFVDGRGQPRPLHHLALSGGGANGAYAAGILSAWSERGDRPQFDIITGVSTGAIIGIFAYLGQDYDQAMVDYYTTTSMEDLFSLRNPFRILSSKSFFDTERFEQEVRETVNWEVMTRMAAVRASGRLLLIGTANLDNQRLAIWDLGRIAQVGTPQALTLLQDLVIASSSVPGAFPAKLLSVSSGGEQFDEMHVDGGVLRQVFLMPQWLNLHELAPDNPNRVYVIRNGPMLPSYQATTITMTQIAARSMESLFMSQGNGDVEFIYHYALANEFEFRVAHIDTDFQVPHPPMSLDYMQALFAYGQDKFRKGAVWETVPPSLRKLESYSQQLDQFEGLEVLGQAAP